MRPPRGALYGGADLRLVQPRPSWNGSAASSALGWTLSRTRERPRSAKIAARSKPHALAERHRRVTEERLQRHGGPQPPERRADSGLCQGAHGASTPRPPRARLGPQTRCARRSGSGWRPPSPRPSAAGWARWRAAIGQSASPAGPCTSSRPAASAPPVAVPRWPGERAGAARATRRARGAGRRAVGATRTPRRSHPCEFGRSTGRPVAGCAARAARRAPLSAEPYRQRPVPPAWRRQRRWPLRSRTSRAAQRTPFQSSRWSAHSLPYARVAISNAAPAATASRARSSAMVRWTRAARRGSAPRSARCGQHAAR